MLVIIVMYVCIGVLCVVVLYSWTRDGRRDMTMMSKVLRSNKRPSTQSTLHFS